jgi:hypothetical protein
MLKVFLDIMTISSMGLAFLVAGDLAFIFLALSSLS